VILLGNPAFDPPRAAPMKTRFKLWYRHVGAAVEHAARCAAWINPDADHVPDQVLDFGSLFLDQEAEDEDATMRSMRPWPAAMQRWGAKSTPSKPATWQA
jgi:hypothetical protein